ncbi:MAG: hypothetical protein JO247_08740 [Chloroflexi bacterium]|nr:hypothetical protein [Chloroflexota bacterium]
MCTMICMQAAIKGEGKGAGGWFPVTQANLGFDHPTHAQAEHSLLIDFVNPDMGPTARVGLEIDIASGKELVAQLQAAIEAAEASGAPE